MKKARAYSQPRHLQDVEQALVYLKLRDSGCAKDKALLFTSKYLGVG
jgi:hypothetical protein